MRMRAEASGHDGNLADRSGQHNRIAAAFSTSQFGRKLRRPCCLDAGAAICKAQAVIGARDCYANRNYEGGMTTTFDKREEGFEKKFAHDEDLKFKASARRNRMLGMWAAEKLGLAGAEAEAYAKEVVIADFEQPGDQDVFNKIRKDLDAKSIAVTDLEIRRTMDELMAQAVAQVKTSG
jgi:hypothetical protein